VKYYENEYNRRKQEIDEFWEDIDKLLEEYSRTQTQEILQEYPEEIKKKILEDI
jgi:DNA-binding transcriptional regulator GbsR (MarR family)